MTENVATESVEGDKSQLVSVTFTNGSGSQVTREVWPEIAEFITSRKAAEVELHRAQRANVRARQQYIWDKEDEFYADPNFVPGTTFDSYPVGRQWDRDNLHVGGGDHTPEEKYWDFVQGNRRSSPNRTRRGNPSSWEILYQAAREAGHKMVTWIIDHCLESEHEATIILQYLPATTEELWEIAKDDHEMCNVFDRYMERAEAAGLFKDIDMPASMRERRALTSYIRRTYGSGYARDFLDRVKPIVRAETEEAVTKARAEWDKELLDKYASSQDLNELIRSLADGHPVVQQHLNRSDAAKAAWERRRAQQDSGDATDAMAEDIVAGHQEVTA